MKIRKYSSTITKLVLQNNELTLDQIYWKFHSFKCNEFLTKFKCFHTFQIFLVGFCHYHITVYRRETITCYGQMTSMLFFSSLGLDIYLMAMEVDAVVPLLSQQLEQLVYVYPLHFNFTLLSRRSEKCM